MGLDLAELQAAVAEHGRVARVVIASLRGSSPREVGAAMLVWSTGQSGTIGGGALEFSAAQNARLTETGGVTQHALGPDLGQCCGGSVTLLTEVFDATNLPVPAGDLFARPVGGAKDPSLRVQRLLNKHRSSGLVPGAQFVDGWMIEPVHQADRTVWVWGAGHVGRAIVSVLAPLPEFSVTWVDTHPDRFPEHIPDGVTPLPAHNPGDCVPFAPQGAEHLILTYSHAIDLDLCHRLLSHGFGFAGLIGSKTKWARFRSRLRQLGHNDAQINRITCPIGRPEMGKHPQAIAIGVAQAMLDPVLPAHIQKDQTA